MKKLLIGMVAAMCCLAFAAPVLAEVKVEGMITNDFYYFEKSKEAMLAAGGLVGGQTTAQDDWSTVRYNMPQPTNRITVRYTGEDKTVNGYIQLRGGGSRANPGSAAAMNAGIPSESAFSWEYAWIDWHVNPNLYFRFGRQDQTFANAYAPAQGLAQVDGHIIGLGFGNITAQSRDAVRAFIKFSDMVRLEIEALDPNTELGFNWLGTGTGGATIGTIPMYSGFEPTLPGQAGTGTANPNANPLTPATFQATAFTPVALESNNIPRFDVSLPIKIANFTVEPGFTWLRQNFQQVAAGSDDSYDIWGATLGGSAAFGPLSFMGEVTYGKNLAPNSSHFGAGIGATSLGGPVAYSPSGAAAGPFQIEDGETLAFFVQGAFNFGPAAIQLIYGQNKGKNDGNPNVARDAAEYEITQRMYGINLPIFITKTFTIVPSVFYYDLDDSAEIGALSATATVDRGSEITAGVQFQLVF